MDGVMLVSRERFVPLTQFSSLSLSRKAESTTRTSAMGRRNNQEAAAAQRGAARRSAARLRRVEPHVRLEAVAEAVVLLRLRDHRLPERRAERLERLLGKALGITREMPRTTKGGGGVSAICTQRRMPL